MDQPEKKLIRRVPSIKVYVVTVFAVVISALILHRLPDASSNSLTLQYGMLVMIGMTFGYMIDMSERWSLIVDPETAAVRYYSNFITAVSIPVVDIVSVDEVVENKTFKRVSGLSSTTSGIKNPNDYISRRTRKVIVKTATKKHEISGSAGNYGNEVKAAISWLHEVSAE